MKLIMNIKNRYCLGIALIALACCNISLNAAQHARGRSAVLTAPQKATKTVRLRTLISTPASSQPNIAAGNELAGLASELNFAGAIDQNLYEAAIKKAQQLKQGNVADRQRLQADQQALIDLQNQLDQSRLAMQQAQQDALAAQQALAAQKPKSAAPMPGGGDAAALAALQQELAEQQKRLEEQVSVSGQLRQKLLQAEQGLADARQQAAIPHGPAVGPSQAGLVLKLQQQLDAQSEAMRVLIQKRDNLTAQLRSGDKGQGQRIIDLQAQLQAQLNEKNDALTLFESVQKKNKKCQKDLEELEQANEKLHQQLAQQRPGRAGTNALQQQIAQLQAQLEQKDADYQAALMSLRDGALEAQRKVNTTMAQKDAEIAALKQQLVQRQPSQGEGKEESETIHELQKQIEQLTSRLSAQAQASKTVLMETVDQYLEQIELQKKQVNQLKKQKDDEIATLRGLIAQRQRQGESKEGAANDEEIRELQRKNQELQARLNQETENFREKLATAKKENLDMRNQHIEMQELAATKTNELQQEMALQKELIEQLRAQLTGKQPKTPVIKPQRSIAPAPQSQAERNWLGIGRQPPLEEETKEESSSPFARPLQPTEAGPAIPVSTSSRQSKTINSLAEAKSQLPHMEAVARDLQKNLGGNRSTYIDLYTSLTPQSIAPKINTALTILKQQKNLDPQLQALNAYSSFLGTLTGEPGLTMKAIQLIQIKDSAALIETYNALTSFAQWILNAGTHYGLELNELPPTALQQLQGFKDQLNIQQQKLTKKIFLSANQRNAKTLYINHLLPLINEIIETLFASNKPND